MNDDELEFQTSLNSLNVYNVLNKRYYNDSVDSPYNYYSINPVNYNNISTTTFYNNFDVSTQLIFVPYNNLVLYISTCDNNPLNYITKQQEEVTSFDDNEVGTPILELTTKNIFLDSCALYKNYEDRFSSELLTKEDIDIQDEIKNIFFTTYKDFVVQMIKGQMYDLQFNPNHFNFDAEKAAYDFLRSNDFKVVLRTKETCCKYLINYNLQKFEKIV